MYAVLLFYTCYTSAVDGIRVFLQQVMAHHLRHEERELRHEARRVNGALCINFV